MDNLASTANIEKILQETFNPVCLSVEDESHKHAGHNEEAKAGGTHFNVTIEAEIFKGKSLIDRHRLVYAALKDFKSIHALSIKAS